MSLINEAIEKGRKVTWWELEETIAEEGLYSRATRMSKNLKPEKQPQGWLKFSQLVDRLTKDETALKAKTWGIDSLTRVTQHLDRLILYSDDKGTAAFSPREWGVFLKMLQETICVIIDLAKAHDKNIIFTVHERISEVPGPNVKVIKRVGTGGESTREYLGALDLKIAASVPGQFGLEFGSYFEEVYGLNVDVVGSKPKWICRVKPDGKRDLRTSCNVSFDECEPDFSLIWKG
jgi:hypothetical protein